MGRDGPYPVLVESACAISAVMCSPVSELHLIWVVVLPGPPGWQLVTYHGVNGGPDVRSAAVSLV